MSTRLNVVLVHGAWADGSSWSGVIERLQADGYHVTAPQFPMTSLAADVARLRQVLDLQDGPTIVAGHSYGGQIMTALGTDAPNAAGLVYIAAFGLDEGESLGALLSQGPTPPALAHLFIDSQRLRLAARGRLRQRISRPTSSQSGPRSCTRCRRRWPARAFSEVMGVPAWKSLPSWYLVATQDEAIPPDAERQFASRMGATTIEVPSSHVAMVSHPAEVTQLIESAAETCAATDARP